MIKNVVFDFGQVLVHFNPSYMVGKYVQETEDKQLLEDVLFDRLYWDRLDEGTITDEEVLAACQKRIPQRLWAVAEKIYYNWIYNIPEIDGMSELIRWVRDDYGKRVFLLSNISKYFADHEGEIPVLKHFERKIFSARCGKVKPNREIFEHLCKECDILPNETLFVDDSEKNIKGAQNYGIKGYLFDGDVARLQAYLEENLYIEN